jgi:phosphoglycolate phosphatase
MDNRQPVKRTHDLILFDLDGTISDPLPGMLRSANEALSYFGYAPCEPARLAAHIGPPMDEVFRAITGLQACAELDALVHQYQEHYADTGFADNRLYTGVPETLARLARAGMPMGVYSSKRTELAERILALLGLRSHFRFVHGGDSGAPKWQQVAELLASGMATTATVVVGDRSMDLLAAHRNGLSAGGVLWGYGSYEELIEQDPRYLFNAPQELLSLAEA